MAASCMRSGRAVIYVAAFVTGGIVMSFEMLGSRYLNPYFGSGIYTWAALISTVLIALTAGYFLGGTLADRTASVAILALTVMIASLYLLALPTFAQGILELVLAGLDDIRAGSLLAALALMFFPVALFGMYSPFAIRLLLRSAQRSGSVSGAVYGVSTAGSIVGTLGTTFFLIPTIGSRAITLTLGALGLIAGLALLALARLERRAGAAFVVLALAALAPASGRAESLIDDGIRADMLKRPNGRLAHIETEYNDIFITKRQNQLVMSFQVKGWDYTESVTNLLDPDDLPLRYAQVMTIATIYPEPPRRILMLGLGGGSISAYLGRFMPDGRDHHRGNRSRRHHRRQDLFRPARDRAHALPGRRRPRVSQPQQRSLRPHPARRLPWRLCPVPPADARVLRPGQAAARAGRRRRLQRP